MYKDVWKRFGTKILIVFCSVLLLGGVAIAAPRLRADTITEKVSLGQIAGSDGMSTSGTVISGAAIQAIADIEYVTNADGTAGHAIPRTLQVSYNGYDSQTLVYNRDYVFSETELRKTQSVSEGNTNGEVEITATAPTSAVTGMLTVADGASLKLKYKIVRARLPKASKTYRIENSQDYLAQNANDVLIVGAKNENLTSSQIKVYITTNGQNEIQLSTTEYEIKDENGNPSPTASELGKCRVQIHFKNYKVADASGGTVRNYDEFSFTIKKDAAKLTMNPLDEDGKPFNPTQISDEPTKIEIFDEGQNVYNLTDFGSPGYQRTDNKLTITVAASSSSNYINSCIKEYTIVKSALDVKWKTPPSTLEYDEKRQSYQIEKQDLIVTVNGTEKPLPKEQYNIISCQIVKSQGDPTVIDGATAGTARIIIEGTSDSAFPGQTGVLFYGVRRSLASSSADFKENVPVNKDDKFIFNGKDHYKRPAIYFSNTPDGKEYILEVNKDIAVEYQLVKRGTGTVENDNVMDAGKVRMVVTGRAGAGDAGYYGTISGEKERELQYDIEPKTVNDYDVEHDPNIYELNGSVPNIAPNVSLSLQAGKDGGENQFDLDDLTALTEYTVTFYEDQGLTKEIPAYEWGSNGTIQSGQTYWAKIEFLGNYCDSIKTSLTTVAYGEGSVIVTYDDGCEEDGQNATGHIYSGEEHVMNVRIVPKSNPTKPLVEGRDYDLDYGQADRINATPKNDSIRVIAQFAGGTSMYINSFRIEPRPVDTPSLILPAEFGTAADGSRTYDYCGTGDAKRPSLKTLTHTYEIDGEDRTITMHEADGDGQQDDYTVEPGLYDDKGNKVDLNKIDATKEYYFAIQPQNNFIGKDYIKKKILVGPFKYAPKNINTDSIIHNDIVMDKWDFVNDDAAKAEAKSWLENPNNFIVTDKDLGEVVLRDNYDIQIDSVDIATDGTIKFSIIGKGCYWNTKSELELKVGKDLANATVREANTQTYHKFVDRETTFVNNYTKAGDGYNLNFSSDYLKANTNVYFGGEAKSNILKFQETDATTGAKYKVVKYTDPTYDDPQKQGKASVTLQGMNGYHGTVTIYIPVQNISFNSGEYEIVFLEPTPLVFANKYLEPDFKVVKKDTGEELPESCYDPKLVEWKNNFHTTEGWEEKDKDLHWGKVTITGQFGYSGTLSAYFEILRRPIVKDTEPGKLDYPQFAFDENGKNALSTIPYVPYTDVDGFAQPQNGAWQNLKLYFNTDGKYEQMKEGDYKFYCTSDKDDTAGKPNPVAGDAYVVIEGTGDYIGNVVVEYRVSPVSIFSDCTVELEGGKQWYPFTGSEIKPTVVVKQKTEKKEYTLTKGVDYDVKYINATFVSQSWNLSAINSTYLIVTGIQGKDGKQGNYTEKREVPYVIYGLLDPAKDSAADRNSRLVYGADPIIVPYSNPMTYDTLGLTLEQKREGHEYTDNDSAPDPNDPDKDLKNTDRKSLQYEEDFTVTCGNPTAGARVLKLHGTSDGKTHDLIVTGAAGVELPVIIQANLADLDESVLWEKNNNSPSVSFTTGASITYEDLANLLTIQCGGREMKYGVDYEFDGDLATTLGEGKRIKIKPTKEAEEVGQYLIGEYRLTYNLTSSIGSGSSNIQEVYVYKHGRKVIDPKNDDFNVVINGQKLLNGDDYTVTVRDEDGNIVTEPKDCGIYQYRIEGKGSYGGIIPGTFEIVPYDFNAEYAQGKVAVTLENDKVTYTGSIVLPNVASVIVKEGKNNTEYTLTPIGADGKGDYGVRAGKGGDNVNWTDPQSGKEPPTVAVYGNANYKGEVSAAYTITKKNISDSDIEVNMKAFENLQYQNGAELKPYPEIVYTDGTEDKNILMSLTGIEYVDANANLYDKWTDLTTHFAYQYLNDVTTTGDKEILVRGIGNFTGTRSILYTVKPLNLNSTKLTFGSEESPVYDGKEQKPGFKLTYNDVEILTCMNGKVSSTRLDSANVRCTFENNINASTEESKAKVTVEVISADNYEGKIEAYFTILPAPLDNHTRFMYRPIGSNADVDLSGYRMNLDFKGVGTTVRPGYATDGAELQEGQVGIYYNFADKANHGAFLIPGGDYYNDPNGDEGFKIEYRYVEPDTDNEDAREEYQDPDTSYAGKVRVTITGKGNYTGKASFWYFIGKDISSDAKISISPTTAVYNSQSQAPTVKISGVDKDTCTIAEYRNEVKVENLIRDRNRDFINAGTYYIRVEGDPKKGTYATKPETLTFTITPRAFSNNLIIDGFKREYSYTGFDICPVGISVTDYIDNIKYRLTEDVDYTLTYTNNLNAGTAYINVEGKNNFSGKATANFMITSSTISSGGSWGSNSFLDQGTGEISGATSVAPSDVNLSMDTVDAMYYTGKAVYPKVSVPGMTENVDYTVTFSNNVEVGTAVATVTGIGNNNGTITKNFRIIAQLSKCTISPIPAQQYTGSEVKPALTVKCGNNILMEGTDYTATYSNNVNIGTATVTLRALNNANYTGTTTVKFSIANDVGGFIISGYAPSYAYTGNAITPGVVVETGSRTLVLGTEYTVSYSNNVNAGVATITVTGIGRYSGTQTATFVIEPKSMQSLDTSDVADRTYTGDAYTPDITVSDGGKVLTKGVDYTVTYKNNTDPGMASIVIQGTNSNYTGTKVISFKISAVAVKGLKASSVKYNSLKLKWTKQGYADGYQICNSNSKVVKTVKANSATITGLSAGKTYKYKVRSYVNNIDGTKSYGAFSSVLSTTTKLKTPTVKVVSKAKGQARISWSKVTGASGYEIYYKKSSKEKYKKLKTVNNPNIRVCTVRGMKSGDRAYFRIRAFRKNGSKKVYSSLNPLKVITVK